MLAFINYYVLQFLFIRITKHYSNDEQGKDILSYWSIQYFVIFQGMASRLNILAPKKLNI